MNEVLHNNQLVAHGILNLAVAAILYVLVQEGIIFRKNKKFGDFFTKSILKNVVYISYVIMIIGLVFG